jgi:hypothetical protein
VTDLASLTAAPAPTFRSHPQDRLCRIGLWLGALGAALCIVPGFGNDPVAEQGAAVIVFEQSVFLVFGAIFFVALVLAAVLPYAWARFAGIGVLGFAPFIYAVLVTAARADERFEIDTTITLGSSGVMLVVAFAVSCIGLVLALVGSPRIGRPAQVNTLLEPVRSTSGYAVTSMVLSLCGLVVLFTAPLGIAFAVAAFHDHEVSKGFRTGRGMAIAGLVVGLVIVSLGALMMAGLMGFADPSINDDTTSPGGGGPNFT